MKLNKTTTKRNEENHCEICGKTFLLKDELIEHLKEEYEEAQSNLDDVTSQLYDLGIDQI